LAAAACLVSGNALASAVFPYPGTNIPQARFDVSYTVAIAGADVTPIEPTSIAYDVILCNVSKARGEFSARQDSGPLDRAELAAQTCRFVHHPDLLKLHSRPGNWKAQLFIRKD
jgi:hypothetical protein